MRGFLRRKLAQLLHCKSGSAVLLTALGLPALLGATAYGIDTAQWYMWQRELQHAVDQAAIGGAWALAYDQDNFQTRATQEYFANQSELTANFDDPDGPSVSLADYDGGDDNSVLVVATMSRELPFTSLLLGAPTTVSARAQASFADGASYQACLFAISDEDKTTFSVGGNATVIANCGLGALSCSDDPPAIKIDGSAKVETT